MCLELVNYQGQGVEWGQVFHGCLWSCGVLESRHVRRYLGKQDFFWTFWAGDGRVWASEAWFLVHGHFESELDRLHSLWQKKGCR